MRLPDFRPSLACARFALAAHQSPAAEVQDALGLRTWLRSPRSRVRTAMIRRYVARLREHRAERTAAAVIVGGTP